MAAGLAEEYAQARGFILVVHPDQIIRWVAGRFYQFDNVSMAPTRHRNNEGMRQFSMGVD